MYRFFIVNLQEWLQCNARQNFIERKWREWPWQRIFGIVCWLIWKNKCSGFWEERRDTKKDHPSCYVLPYEGVENGIYKHHFLQNSTRNQARLWIRPKENFIRLDVHGAVTHQGVGAIAGVARDIINLQQKRKTHTWASQWKTIHSNSAHFLWLAASNNTPQKLHKKFKILEQSTKTSIHKIIIFYLKVPYWIQVTKWSSHRIKHIMFIN